MWESDTVKSAQLGSTQRASLCSPTTAVISSKFMRLGILTPRSLCLCREWDIKCADVLLWHTTFRSSLYFRNLRFHSSCSSKLKDIAAVFSRRPYNSSDNTSPLIYLLHRPPPVESFTRSSRP